MRRVACALIVCVAAGCSRQEQTAAPAVNAAPSATPQPRLLVLATIAPMYCFAKNIVGDLADVEMIVPPGMGSGPAYKASAGEVKRIAQADMVVENGFGYEKWMDELVASGGLKPGAVRVIAARGTGPAVPGLPGDPNSPPGDVPEPGAGTPDPHVWLDPVMAIKEVQNIRDALMARDPAHADEYLANENRYEAALRDLDDEVGRETVDMPKRKVFCEDGTFRYFLKRYEFTIFDSPVADAVLVFRTDIGDQVTGLGQRFVHLDPMETGSGSVEYYEERTRSNVEALRKALEK